MAECSTSHGLNSFPFHIPFTPFHTLSCRQKINFMTAPSNISSPKYPCCQKSGCQAIMWRLPNHHLLLLSIENDSVLKGLPSKGVDLTDQSIGLSLSMLTMNSGLPLKFIVEFHKVRRRSCLIYAAVDSITKETPNKPSLFCWWHPIELDWN